MWKYGTLVNDIPTNEIGNSNDLGWPYEPGMQIAFRIKGTKTLVMLIDEYSEGEFIGHAARVINTARLASLVERASDIHDQHKAEFLWGNCAEIIGYYD